MAKSNEEKTMQQMHILIQQTLYEKFIEKCNKEYKTKSQKIRELIVEYLKENK